LATGRRRRPRPRTAASDLGIHRRRDGQVLPGPHRCGHRAAATSSGVTALASAGRMVGRNGGGPMLELVIRGGTVIDGTAAPRRTADVGVKDGTIAAVGQIDEQ